MNKILTYIASLAAIMLFLASSTGISFVIHHCSDNNTNEFHLFVSDYQCAHEKAPNCCADEENSKEHDCCNVNKNEHCCKNTKGYFKISDEYTFDRNNKNFSPPIVFIANSFLFTDNLFHSEYNIYTSKSPPIKQSGQDILSFHSQFRI